MRAPRLFATLLTASFVGSGLVALVGAPAQAEDLNATLITPTTGDQVSGDLSIEVALTGTDTVMVAFRSGAQTRTQMIADYTNGDLVDGVARWTLPSFGLDAGTVITVAPCGTSTPSTCLSTPTDTETIDVSNPVTWDAPTEPVFVDLNSEALPSVTVHDDGPGELSLHWANQGQWPALVRDQPRQLTVSPSADVVSGELVVRRCIRDNGATFYGMCANESTSAQVTARRHLKVSVSHPVPGLLSPNGDGKFDTATVTVTTEGLAGQIATWQLETLAGVVLTDPQPITLDANGDAEIVVDPAALGVVATSGEHRVRMSTQATDHGHEFSGVAYAGLTFDVTAPRITQLTANLTTFYPFRDRFLDTVAFTPRRQGVIDSSTIEVIDASGVSIRNIRATLTCCRFFWDGRDARGAVAPDGRYRIRTTVADNLGNESVFVGRSVTLSRKRLVEKTWRRTVSAQGSLWRNVSGRCSSLRKPGLRRMTGSIGYYSQSRCRGRTLADRTAIGLHRTKIPAAVKYGPLSMSAYGAAVKPRNQASLILIDNNDEVIQNSTLTPGLSWHRAGAVYASRLRWPDGHVYWAVGAGYGQRYDVKSFKVSLSYYVLG